MSFSESPRRTFVAVLLLAAASGTAIRAQEQTAPAATGLQQPGAVRENAGMRTLSREELETLRKPLTAGPKVVTPPAQVFPGDHAASGTSLRNRGGGVINLRGVPAAATPIKALLYWDVLLNTPATPSMSVSVNGAAVTGKLIGKGADPCWGAQLNAAYQADVPLYLVYIGINGDYQIAGVPSGRGNGDDPWQSPATPAFAEGASLVVIYRHANSTFTKTYVYESPLAATMFFTTFAATLGGFSPPAPLNQAKLTLIGADGQVGGGLQAFTGTTAETSFFQGQQIAGPNGNDNDSDWNGRDSGPLNQLWDTRTHIVPIKQNSTSAPVQYLSLGDCLVTVAFVLSL